MAARNFVGVRISDRGVQWMSEVVTKVREGQGVEVTRSDILRASLAFAARNETEFRLMLEEKQ